MCVTAQLDEKGVCFCVAYSGEAITGKNIVMLEEGVPEGYATHADYYCGRSYANGEWAEEKERERISADACEVPEEPEIIPYETVMLREIKEYLLLNMRISLEAMELVENRSASLPEAEEEEAGINE